MLKRHDLEKNLNFNELKLRIKILFLSCARCMKGAQELHGPSGYHIGSSYITHFHLHRCSIGQCSQDCGSC